MKRIIYIAQLFMQGYMLLVSMINITINLIEATGNVFTRAVYPCSIYLFFIPYNRYIDENNFYEILILILFFVISFTLLILSAKELFNKNNRKAPFTILNILWFGISTIVARGIDNVDNREFAEFFIQKSFCSFIFEIIVILMQILVIFIKWSEQNNVIRNNPLYENEEFLPESFKFSAKSYSQIKRTAMGTPVISVGIFLVCLLLKYLNKNLTFGVITFLYGISILIMITIFCGCIYDYRIFQSKYKEKLPAPYSLKMLNKIQGISFMLFVSSYLIMLI